MYELPKVRICMVRESSIVSDRKISNSKEAGQLIKEELQYSDREVFGVINLNSKGNLINWNTVSIGTLNGSLVEPREVFKSSILSNASAVLAFHCHPSGDATPSLDDMEATKAIKDAGEVLRIPLVDHIIAGCGSGDTYSLRENTDLWD